MRIIGMPDTEVLEASSRVRCAIKACGYAFPQCGITVNLVPNGVKKSGTGFDLAIAAAVLVASGQVDPSRLDGCSLVGELSLSGDVVSVRGPFCHAIAASERGLTLVCSGEGPYPDGAEVREIRSLKQISGLPEIPASGNARKSRLQDTGPDMADIPGMWAAKRAAAIAAAGGHGLLLVGPPGCGKTMLARRIPGIMPEWDPSERAKAAAAWSAAGLCVEQLFAERPFRSPHHSASVVSLIGGGRPVRPGEASLAHGGVLYLDDIQEFAQRHLMAVKCAIEDGSVTIVRADGRYEMPASFTLVASAKPCPCGFFGTDRCTCTERQISEYGRRLGGPLMGCFDLVVNVGCEKSVSVEEPAYDTAHLADMVKGAREMREGRGGCSADGELSQLDSKSRKTLFDVGDALNLAHGQYARAATVARTIAGLDGSARVNSEHIIEALSYTRR